VGALGWKSRPIRPCLPIRKEAAMAFVSIKKATVNRIIEGYGFEAINKFTDRNGNERTERFTIWTKEQAPAVGQTVDINGSLSAKVEEFTNNQGELIRYAAIHVNNPDISVVDDQPALEDAPF